MPNGIKKENLPRKVCVVCNRPFTWRKKWENVWDEVTTCSKSCNRKRRALNQQFNRLRQRENGVSGLNVNVDDLVSSDDARTDAADEHSPKAVDAQADPFIGEESDSSEEESNELDPRAARKAAKKRAKAERRAKREGRLDTVGQKNCHVCNKSVDLLIRCTIDESQAWTMVCGKCWKDVSGGVVDGDANHPHYRYGGLWKNRARRN